MAIVLFLIPLFAVISGFLIYRHNGRRQFLQLDLVQFLYAFVLVPLFFVWVKTFTFFLLRSEESVALSAGQLFAIDTAVSLLLFYMYAFFVMHSLTKTFRLNSEKDPLYDLFHHSEYIHLWLTHIVTAIGTMALLVLLATINVFFPLTIHMSETAFYFVCAGGIVLGCVSFIGLWLTDPRQDGRRYMRLMKLAIGIAFAFLASTYLLFNPNFSQEFSLFWFVFFAFSTMLVWSLFSYKSPRVYALLARFADKHKDTEHWGNNPQLFNKSEEPKMKG